MTREPLSVAPDVGLLDAHELMRGWGMRHLPVTEKDGAVVGLLSERDILRYFALHPNNRKGCVSDAMAKDPYIVDPDTTLAEVATTMANNKYGCAIVADNRRICGIFTTTDALKVLAQILREPDGTPFKIMRIEDYINSACA